ncbi:MAG: hydroxyacid dehydrogenase [Proteobacteria bacterium]|nr:hydroxyacid dehydrogenase [Pseudomonadota bacterium]
MRVLLADKLPDEAKERLEQVGFEVRAEATLVEASLVAAMEEFQPDVLVVRSTKVRAEHIGASSSLSLVVRAGAGVNNIDMAACGQQGVFVSNCPGKNAVAVAELAIGLMVALDRKIPDNVADLRAGRWNKKSFSKARGLKGCTVGIIGLGKIGSEVLKRAKAMEMDAIVYELLLTEEMAEELEVVRAESLLDVARAADVVTIHLPLNDKTRGLVGAEFFDSMKPGSFLINTSRAPIIDEDALLQVLDERDLRAGLDLFSNEPAQKEAPFDHPVAKHPRVYGTHHIGASTTQAQQAVADEACRVIEAYKSTGRAPNCVNLTVKTSADHCLVVRHLDRVGVLAAVFDLLREVEINVQEMENTIFAGGGAAIARIQLHGQPPDWVMEKMEQSDRILHVSLLPL